MSNLNLLWATLICCERFEFAVGDLNLLWAICNLLWVICNSLWAIWICCERFEFAVSDLNLLSAIWIWCERFVICCEHLVLMWQLWATVLYEHYDNHSWKIPLASFASGLKNYPGPPCAPSFFKSRLIRVLHQHVTHCLYVHVGETIMPPRCGGNNNVFSTFDNGTCNTVT